MEIADDKKYPLVDRIETFVPAPTIFPNCDDRYTYDRLFIPLNEKFMKPAFSRLKVCIRGQLEIDKDVGDICVSGTLGHSLGDVVPPPTTLGSKASGSIGVSETNSLWRQMWRLVPIVVRELQFFTEIDAFLSWTRYNSLRELKPSIVTDWLAKLAPPMILMYSNAELMAFMSMLLALFPVVSSNLVRDVLEVGAVSPGAMVSAMITLRLPVVP